MTDPIYIEIPNWDGPNGFQHYKERDPIWIKNYTRLLSHDAYTELSYHQRGILHSLWMEYARANRQLRGDTLTLTRRLGHRVLTRDLTSLSDAGFIRLVASPPLAECEQDASDPLALARVKAETYGAETNAEEEGNAPPSVTSNPEPSPKPEDSYEASQNGHGAGDFENSFGGEPDDASDPEVEKQLAANRADDDVPF